jgi:hypothetical protein
MTTRYTYAHGYKSLDHANVALEELIAGGEVSRGEFPRVERYSAKVRAATSSGLTSVWRYQITLEG